MADNLCDRLTKFCKLASKLPPTGDAGWLVCENCGADLGGVGNRRGVAFGNFRNEVVVTEFGCIFTRPVLLGFTVIRARTIPLKCGQCGFVKRWRAEA